MEINRQARADVRAAPTRRRKAVFLCLSPSRSRPLEQAKKQTDGTQTRANTRLLALNAQEGRREQREKKGEKSAGNGDFRRAMLKRTRPETAPTQGERAKKSQPDKGWDFTLWWWGRTPRQTQRTGLVLASKSCFGKMRNPQASLAVYQRETIRPIAGDKSKFKSEFRT